MGNVGLKIAQSGIDVTKAADNQLIYSSSFKLPQVIFQGQKTITAFGSDATIFKHGLGYVPVFFCYVRTHSTNQVELINLIKINKEDLKYKANDYSEAFTVTYFIFNIPLFYPYEASKSALIGIQRGISSKNIGFKIAKLNKNVLTASLEDLQLYSGASLANNPVRNHIIQKIIFKQVAKNSTTVIKHGLGYKPMAVSYITDTTVRWFPADTLFIFDVMTGNFSEAIRIWVDKENINIRVTNDNLNATEDFYIVLFKDPLL